MIQFLLVPLRIPQKITAEVTAFVKNFPKLSRAVADLRPKQKGQIMVSLISDAKIRKINLKYRSLPSATDVLSFSYAETAGPAFRGEPQGEIIISYEHAAHQAKAMGLRLRDELTILAAHGALHIFGYDHEKSYAKKKAMLAAENKVLSRLKLKSGLISR